MKLLEHKKAALDAVLAKGWYLTERNVPSKWVFCTTSGGQLSSSQAAAIFRRLTKTTATCMRKSVAIAHRESTSEIQSAISEAMLHSMAVHRESYAAKAF
ncbi:hypothetical protein RRG08_066192 [Elysia crispata]|uniref:Uncharacterized protein n=1 Tax=Elysia crispata TaxID=231223 RepID=A0AAE0YVC8_9GAST|nr:hypothetical protein RRG08_066192 [Elysia crispata]KAK3757718.1 hypothetical protein RRG08_066192 [Elysia crispata]KAK3757719.1 hypothetical protein RRG08_066192 [Elysia crispata]